MSEDLDPSTRDNGFSTYDTEDEVSRDPAVVARAADTAARLTTHLHEARVEVIPVTETHVTEVRDDSHSADAA
jgi:hypothetical protein